MPSLHRRLRQRAAQSLRFRAERYFRDPRHLAVALPAANWARTPFYGDTDTYSEWSVISEPTENHGASSPELIELGARAALRAGSVDLEPVLARTTRDFERRQVARWPGEHYRLLVALAELVGAEVVVEVGTFTGASALTFLQAPTVRQVTTYDVVPWDAFEATMLRPEDMDRIDQRLVDLSAPGTFDSERPILEAADLVFVDGPKDGAFEYQFIPRLLSTPPSRPQLVVVDDIRLMPMIKLWRSIPDAKLDLTSFGHWSGTGLILRSPAA